MRITSWNFLHGQSLNSASESENTRSLEASLKELAPDVIALQEVDFALTRSAMKNQTAEVAEFLDADEWAFAPTLIGTPGISWRKLSQKEQQLVSGGAPTRSKDWASHRMAGSYGIGLISTVPVKRWERLELGRSWIGAPLAAANKNGNLRLLYVRDEPRVALAAVLENGFTVINTHLSFIPFFNIYQLLKVIRWAAQLEDHNASRVILVGDLNLGWGIPSLVTRWVRITRALSYPSWNPKISFDYILIRTLEDLCVNEISVHPIPISDHRPISVEIKLVQQ